MGLSTNLGDKNRWPGAENYYGGADLSRDLSGGKSAAEIQAWASKNADKIRSKETWNMINSLKDSPKSGGGGGGGGGGSNSIGSNVDPFATDPFFMDDPTNSTNTRTSQVDVFDGTDQEQVEDMLGTAFNQTINQNASIDNRMQNNFSNNTFGAGASVGNNNSVNTINQSASQEIGYDNRRGAAKERAQRFIEELAS